jgi:hypothetical protein
MNFMSEFTKKFYFMPPPPPFWPYWVKIAQKDLELNRMHYKVTFIKDGHVCPSEGIM